MRHEYKWKALIIFLLGIVLQFTAAQFHSMAIVLIITSIIIFILSFELRKDYKPKK